MNKNVKRAIMGMRVCALLSGSFLSFKGYSEASDDVKSEQSQSVPTENEILEEKIKLIIIQ